MTSLSRLSSLSQVSNVVDRSRPESVAQNSSVRHHGNTSVDLDKPQPPLPQGSLDGSVPAREPRSSAQETQHQRWCTTREHKNVFKTYDGFAKHEKEHDQYFVFLPHGPVEKTAWGFQCALCETLDPSKEHLQYHNTLKYEGRLGKPITRSRKGNFRNLLKKHKASDEKLNWLLENWRDVPNKKAYSCGFCVNFFRTLSDRSNHIDREHYAKGEHVDGWDDNLVIKGLLLQPEVKRECLRLFAPIDPTLAESKVKWPAPAVEDLQLRLELMDEIPRDLATDAFRQADRRGLFPPDRSSTSSNRHHQAQVMNSNETSFGSDGPLSVRNESITELFGSSQQQSRGFYQKPQANNQYYNNDQNTVGISQMSVSSPSESSNTGFVYATSNDGIESTQSNQSSRMLSTRPPSHHLHNIASDNQPSIEDPFFITPLPDFHPLQSFSNPSAPEATFCTTSPTQFHPHVDQQMFVDPGGKIQTPKRKLSDKSAKEANLRAQTLGPNQHTMRSIQHTRVG